MKVLDLQCSNRHVFEGWFASEDDFANQLSRGLVSCPLCADVSITKKLSAPRLNLGSPRDEPAVRQDVVAAVNPDQALQAAWLALAQQVMANTDDVGEKFAEEARKIHYGEQEARGLRGTATLQEAQSLIDEGIDIVSLPMPLALKGRLQ